MRLDDLFVFSTIHLLKMPEHVFLKAVDDFSTLFAEYEFQVPRKINAFSISALDQTQKEWGYFDWLINLRKNGFQEASISILENNSSLPAPIAASFANGVLQILKLSSQNQIQLYSPRSLYSRSTWVSGPELKQVIDFQFSDEKIKKQLWQKILEKDVQRFGDFMKATTIEEAYQFMLEGYEDNFCPANDILKTVQYFCVEVGTDFNFPEFLKEKFEKIDNVNLDFDLYAPYASEILTGVELVEWIKSQNNETLWPQLIKELAWIFEIDPLLSQKFKNDMSIDDLKASLAQLSTEDIMKLPMGNFTSAFGPHFVIPENLKSKFTYPKHPPIPDQDLWRAKSHPEPWQMLQFVHLAPFGIEAQKKSSDSVNAKNGLDLKLAIQKFTEQLILAEQFAKKIESPFSEAFAFSNWILNNNLLDLSLKDQVSQSALKAGFSEKAIHILQSKITFDLHKVLKISSDFTRISLSLELASVFGGMGSWNDLGFSDDSLQAEYESLTANLFKSYQNLQMALNAI